MGSKRRGLVRLAALLAAIAAAVALAILFSSPGGRPDVMTSPRTGQPAGAPQVSLPPKLVVRLSRARLPAAVSGEAAVGRRTGVLLIGGLDAGLVSTSGVLELRADGTIRSVGSLAEPLHDAAAAVAGGRTLVFGGGAAATIDQVEVLNPGGTATLAGRLPQSASDLAAQTVGGRAYVLGGYDGATPLASVLETTDGSDVRKIGRLPATARYAATASLGHTIYSFGGELADGSDSDAIQAFDVRTGRAKLAGNLSQPLSHASAIEIGGRIYVLGGRTAGTATDRILAFDAGDRRPSVIGRLPMAVTNAAAATTGRMGYLAGGLDANGTALRSVISFRLAPRGTPTPSPAP